MKPCMVYLFATLLFSSCDCRQNAAGIVLDTKTKRPVANVSVGQHEEDPEIHTPVNYTNKDGLFDYSGISGGLTGCPGLELYFSKAGYKTNKIVLGSSSKNDTVYLEKLPLQADRSIAISQAEFDREVDFCISLLRSTALKNIMDEQQIQIMYCLNTILAGHFCGGHYNELKELAEQKDYSGKMITIYKDWIPNRGMGFYFPHLQRHATPVCCL